MTAQELIAALKQFHPNEEIIVEMYDTASRGYHVGDVDQVTPNNGARERILLRSTKSVYLTANRNDDES